MRFRLFAWLAFWTVGASFGQESTKPETARIEFITEYVRQLGESQSVRDAAAQELAEAKTDGTKTASAIHFFAAMRIQLRSETAAFQNMNLHDPYNQVIPFLLMSAQEKSGLYERMIEIETEFMGGPKPDVDYDKLAAEMPQIRAEVEDFEKSEFKTVNQLVAYMMIAEDGKHLSVTQAERKQLLQMLRDQFGNRLTMKGQNYTVGSAQILYSVLTGDRKAADESDSKKNIGGK